MATYSWMSAPGNTSDTTFHKWTQGIHDAFAACGWVQTADTGQVDLATVTAPAASTTVAGIEIWRLDDALQATAPVFVKIEYGTGQGTVSTVGLWLSVGKGSNGAGTLSDTALLPRTTLFSATGESSTAVEYASYASGDGSSLNIVFWPGYTGATGNLGSLHIERSRDTAGAATAGALLIAYSIGGSDSGAPSSFNVIGYAGAFGSSQVAVFLAVPVCLPSVVNGMTLNQASASLMTLSKDGVVAPVLPIPCMAPGVEPWVSNNIVVVSPGDAGATSVILAATINGATRTYRAFPYSYSPNSPGLVRNASYATSTYRAHPAILWED